MRSAFDRGRRTISFVLRPSSSAQKLINLVEAYDIETIIRYNVDVALAHDPGWTRNNVPRLFGQPVVHNVKRTSSDAPIDAGLLNFTLSAGKLPLSPGESFLTFFFNTKSPEKFKENE